MNILVKRVGMDVTVETARHFEDMQTLVGGYVQTVPLGNGFVMNCNEEGHLIGLESNFVLNGELIVGDVHFCKVEQGEYVGLNEQEINILKKRLGFASEKERQYTEHIHDIIISVGLQDYVVILKATKDNKNSYFTLDVDDFLDIIFSYPDNTILEQAVFALIGHAHDKEAIKEIMNGLFKLYVSINEQFDSVEISK